MTEIRPTAARLLADYPVMAEIAVKSFATSKFDAGCRQAILAEAAKSADAHERALSARDLDLTDVKLVGRDDASLSLTLTYVGQRDGYRTTAEIPLTLTGPALEGARAAIEQLVTRGPLQRVAKSKGLWQDPALEANIVAALGGQLTAHDIVSVTMGNGDTYFGRKMQASYFPFDGHPGNDGMGIRATPPANGDIYVTTNTKQALSGRETLNILADENGKLVVRSSRVLSIS